MLGLADVLSEFTQAFPEIHIELSLNSRTVDLVEGGFDIGIRAGKSHDASLVVRPIGNAALGLFASPAYLERRGTPRTLADLATHDAVLFRVQGTKALWRLDGPNDEVFTVELAGRINTDEMLFVRQAVAAGLGIGLLPVLIESACIEKKRIAPLERVLPDYGVRGVDLSIVTPTGPRRPRRVTLLRDFLAERLRVGCARVASSAGVAHVR